MTKLSEKLLRKYYANNVHPYRNFERHIDRLLKTSDTLLDAGCGRTVPVLRNYLGRAKRLIGVDLVEFTDVPAGIEVYVADLAKLPLPDSSVDIIMSRSVFEHLREPEPVYREFARVLRPGGAVVFLTANMWDYGTVAASLIPNRFHGKVVKYVEGREEEDTFPIVYKTNSRTQVTRLAAISGLAIDSFQYLSQYPNYLLFNGALFFLGMCYEKLISRFEALKFLRGWIMVTLHKPAASVYNSGKRENIEYLIDAMKLFSKSAFAKAERSKIGGDSFTANQLAWFFTALLSITILLTYRDQVALVLESWETMPSHAHGYVVILVVAYLVWEKRHALAGLSQAPSKAGMAALVLSSVAALAGELVSAAVVVQFAVVFMLQSAVWAVMGGRIFRIIFGPLNFLFFAIPFGHDVLPTLMDWTANATVIGLRASGIPVFQESRFFIIPSGSWSVVEACSGVRYLLTSFFVGTIFAYVTYTSWYKRLIFVFWMLVLSLFANWLRAYVIVMVAHLSNNQWGLGLSHLAFGWVIFAVVVLVSFAVGVRWRDSNIPVERMSAGSAAPIGVTIVSAMFAVALVLGFSQAANQLHNQLPRTIPVLDLADSLNGLEQVQPALPMVNPKFLGASAIHAATYRFEDSEIGLTVGYYRNQRQGAELINVNNMIEPTHTWAWKRSQRIASLGEGIPTLRVEYYSRPEANAVVVTVYWVGGRTTVSESISKLYQAINLVIGKGDDAAMIVISSTDRGNTEAAMTAVKAFIRDRLPRVLNELDAIQAETGR